MSKFTQTAIFIVLWVLASELINLVPEIPRTVVMFYGVLVFIGIGAVIAAITTVKKQEKHNGRR